MTPQGHFNVIAVVAEGHEGALREMLERLNASPGHADPKSPLLPWDSFEQLHFARFVVLVDPSLDDISVYGIKRAAPPTYLAFMGDCDGDAHQFLEDLVQKARRCLGEIFAHCADFNHGTDLLAWMLKHDRPIAAAYVNWLGRTVQQIKQEDALQRALTATVPRLPLASGNEARQVRLTLQRFVDEELKEKRLRLTKPEPTPFGWILAQALYFTMGLVVGVLLFLLALPLSPWIVWHLRRLETSDPEICPRPELDALQALQRIEDFDVTNQYTAIGSLKPGLFRKWLATILVKAISYVALGFFHRGYLARVRTIHFARWVFLDGGTRMVFASSYDGGHEAYMDDFINKVAWGLNLSFSHGVGWPKTDWLICRGARREHLFKYFQRRHQIPTQVWYKAYPGLTLLDMERNHRIRLGLYASDLSDEEVLDWLKLL